MRQQGCHGLLQRLGASKHARSANGMSDEAEGLVEATFGSDRVPSMILATASAAGREVGAIIHAGRHPAGGRQRPRGQVLARRSPS